MFAFSLSEIIIKTVWATNNKLYKLKSATLASQTLNITDFVVDNLQASKRNPLIQKRDVDTEIYNKINYSLKIIQGRS